MLTRSPNWLCIISAIWLRLSSASTPWTLMTTSLQKDIGSCEALSVPTAFDQAFWTMQLSLEKLIRDTVLVDHLPVHNFGGAAFAAGVAASASAGSAFWGAARAAPPPRRRVTRAAAGSCRCGAGTCCSGCSGWPLEVTDAALWLPFTARLLRVAIGELGCSAASAGRFRALQQSPKRNVSVCQHLATVTVTQRIIGTPSNCYTSVACAPHLLVAGWLSRHSAAASRDG